MNENINTDPDKIKQEQAELLEMRAKYLGSLLLFTKSLYKIRTGRDFNISQPDGMESHFIQIFRKLTQVLKGEIKRLIINIPPRYGKTECLIHFIAWALARYPTSNFLYVSYSHSLAAKQTRTIRDIINMPAYRKLFGIELSDNSSAKDDFEIVGGGSVYAAGSGGTITGRGAGIMGCKSFGGAVVIDDIHKPDEVTSDTMRESVIDWYYNTMQSRLNDGRNTPIIIIGQRLHEYDLLGKLLETMEWNTLVLPALSVQGNALYPELHTKEDLLKMKEGEPYVFSAQYQQEPQPSGGSIYKPEWFVLMNEQPNIIETFITSDTAETDKDYNDKTVFSFWGLYRIIQRGVETDLYGLHWLDCVELSIEPKDLEDEFWAFYTNCMRFTIKPKCIAIEKKSTGVTLSSILGDIQGLKIIKIERTRSSGNKTTRFLEIQPYVASKRVSFPVYASHTNKCIEHCKKITANNTHRFDDIADTLYDAVKLALIDKTVTAVIEKQNSMNNQVMAKQLMGTFSRVQSIKRNRDW